MTHKGQVGCALCPPGERGGGLRWGYRTAVEMKECKSMAKYWDFWTDH